MPFLDPSPLDRGAAVRAGRPIVFGEVLFDTFADGTSRLGGAPLNVAVHLAGLGERPLLISRVGTDPAGERALAELARFGVDTSAVQLDELRPTGEVRVELVDGEPHFEILADRAWDAIDPEAAVRALQGANPALLYHGVLAARQRLSRRALAALRACQPAEIVVDVNLRPPGTPVERALELCRAASWIKLNAAELAALTAALGCPAPAGLDTAAEALLERTGARRLVVTRGAAGAALFDAGGERLDADAPPIAADDGDPVGAGDAFAAAMIVAGLHHWPSALALARATELAAAVCALKGALPDQPDWHEPFRRWAVA